MVLYENLGYSSIDEYEKDFMDTLLITNHNFDFFVNWDKIYDKLMENLTEISILNSLNKVPSDKVEEHFREIITYYPEVVPILPSILAVRYENNKKYIIDIFDGEFKEYNFNDESYNVDDILYFSQKTGLLDLFNNITDLYTYLLGTEVGLDSHARKSRSGSTYESMIEELLEIELKNYDEYSVTCQGYVKHIYRNKRADFIIMKNDVPKIIIECNFYNSTGSKPIEVASSYINLQDQLFEEGLIFIWVTDGQGWKRMFKTIQTVNHEIDYLLNYNMLKNNLLNILDLSE